MWIVEWEMSSCSGNFAVGFRTQEQAENVRRVLQSETIGTSYYVRYVEGF